jgi:2-polyprenyl-3-methyl-5-hydroxy-6-metoxy-1,4-benzoquinol methylase
MTRGIIVSDYAYEQIHKLNGDDGQEFQPTLIARDRIGEAFFGQFGDKESTAKVRNRLYWMARQTKGLNILDVGTSEGVLPILVAREGRHVIGIDINAEAIEYARQLLIRETEEVRKRVAYKVVDFTSFIDGHSFDTIVAGELIEHVTSPETFIEMCCEALEPEGRLVLTTPFGLHPDPDHKVTFFLSDIADLIDGRLEASVLDVVDGYIRLVANKPVMKTAGKSGDTISVQRTPSMLPDALLQVSERGIYAAQVEAQRRLDERRRSIQQISKWIKTVEVERDNAEAEREAAKKDAAAIRNELDKAINEIAAKEKAATSWELDLKSLRNEISDLKTVCKTLINEILVMKVEFSTAKKNAASIRHSLVKTRIRR